ncbi:MAG: hypothetical protein Q4D98_04975 [Planctomycetia bacterium]|nr:hypothetical protein [Planctomycetia bacterium]
MKKTQNRIVSLWAIGGVLGGVLLLSPVIWGEEDTLDFPTLENTEIVIPETPVEIPEAVTEEKPLPAEKAKEVREVVREEVGDEAAEVTEQLLTADLLLPETTCAYLSVRDFIHFRETWKKTLLGELMMTPQMQVVTEDLNRQVQAHFENVRSRLGVTLDDIRQIASGEISMGVLLTSPQKYAVVTIIDVRNHQVETQKVLTRVSKRVVEDGGKQTKQMISDAEVYFLDIPDKDHANVIHKAIYVLKDNLLIASDDREVIQGILKRFVSLKSEAGELLPCLADVDGYLNVLENSITGEMLPDVVWYIDPIRYATVRRIMAVDKDPMNVRGRSVAEMLTESGFDGIEAIGGVVTLESEGYDAVHRTFISIPAEPKGSLKMLKFPESEAFEVPEWIGATAGTLHFVNLDFMNVFDNMGPMVNQFFGEGDSGVWEDVLAGLQEDPYGPQVDLRKDLIAHFKNHLMFIVQNDRPKEVDGERRLVIIPLEDDEKVQESMVKLLTDEPMIETTKLPNGEIIWHVVRDEEAEEDASDTPKREALFPELAITVWNDYLIIASHVDFLEAIKSFDPATGAKLVDDPGFQLVDKELDTFAGEVRGSVHYFNTARNTEHLYEMFRTGKIPQSTSLEAKRINKMLATEEKTSQELRKPLFDGSTLPEYDDIRSYFLPSGATILTKEKGFIFQGFWLSEEKMDDIVEVSGETVSKEKTRKPVKKSRKAKKAQLLEVE